MESIIQVDNDKIFVSLILNLNVSVLLLILLPAIVRWSINVKVDLALSVIMMWRVMTMI